MKKVLLIISIISQLYAQDTEYETLKAIKQKFIELLNTELQYAYGKSNLTLSELTKKESYEINSYSFVNEHQNTTHSKINYYYEAGFYHSKTDKRYDAFSFDAAIGYDIVSISKEEYISIGLMSGLYTLNAAISQTQQQQNIGFYKLGVRISFAKQLLDSPLFAYGMTNYSMHYTHRGVYDGEGIFNEAKIGIHIKDKTYTHLLLSAGVRYTLVSSKDTKLGSSLNYVGLSYIF